MVSVSFTQQDWLYLIALFSAAVVFGNGIHYVVFRVLQKQKLETQRRSLGFQRYLGKPARGVLMAAGLRAVLPWIPHIPGPVLDRADQVVECVLVLFVGWLALGGVYVFQAFTLSRFDTTVSDNLRARRVHTHMQFLRRVLIGLVVLLDIGALLWSLHDPRLWKFGTGLLASAGLASLILATAAKSTASNLIAGMQIALSEPIRIDDVVVIQGEWGRIEEITSTYVVLKIWDERRLVIPLSLFIEQPFENWTRSKGELLGTAFLYVDYTAPIDDIRAELTRAVSESPLWDGRVCGLQVTNLTDRSMELRCLVSASGSSQLFDLRCVVRERMIEFLRAKAPRSLPTMRVEMDRTGGDLGETGGDAKNGHA